MANPMPHVGTLSRGQVAQKVRLSIIAVRAVCSLLKQHFRTDSGIAVSEIVEGGSLGYGTYVPMKFDIDLVIYSTSLTADKLCDRDKRKKFLSDLQECVKVHLKGNYIADKMTENSVQFKYQFSPDNTIDVDVLISPMWGSPVELSQYVSKNCPTEFFHLSAGAAKWQKKFMSHQTLRVKEYIKRAKYWSLTVNWEAIGGRKPTSYMMSLLVIKAAEPFEIHMKGRLRQNFKKQLAKDITKNVKTLVKKFETIDILFDSDYPFPNALLPSPPRVVDPANICNNLYETGFGKLRRDEDSEKYWKKFAENIDTLDLSVAFEHRGFYSDVPAFGKSYQPKY